MLSMYKTTWLAVLVGFVLDCFLADPAGFPHPVVLMGKTIQDLEKKFRQAFSKTDQGEMRAGFLLTVVVLVLFLLVPYLLLYGAWKVNSWFYFILASFFSWQVFAARTLQKEACKVKEVLETQGLELGRQQVARLVGRDTRDLSMEGVVKACVETVAENTTDGVTAPLFWMMVGGPAAGLAYKAVNTMDSMLGYRNPTYLYFGRIPAKLDDLVNYIPAHLTGRAMVFASGLAGYDREKAKLVWERDRRKTDSPNAGQTEAPMAGALNIQLGGDAVYFGKLYKKPALGDEKRPAETEDIARASSIMYITSFFLLACFLAIAGLCLKIFV